MASKIGRGDTAGHGSCANGPGTGNSMGPRERWRLFGDYRQQWGARG